MSEAWQTEQVETPAGTYTVEIYPDDDAPNYLDDDESVAALIEYAGYGDSWDESTNTLDRAGRAGEVLRELLTEYGHEPDQIGRRYLKWSALTGSPWVLATGGRSASQSDYYYRYAVLANSDDLPDVEQTITNVMEDYQTYASGQVVGYVTKAPNGDVVESVWGFYGVSDAIAEGTNAAKASAEHRTKQANLVGAGIVGLI